MKVASIVTHNGRFHADEVLSCMILQRLYPDCSITRTRTKSIIDSADIVVDVGGVYDISTLRFDHHQFELTHEHYGKSSAGLIWSLMGHQYLSKIMDTENAEIIQLVYDHASILIKGIDDHDVGIARSHNDFGISNIIANMNPIWDEVASPDIRFMEALDMMRTIFEQSCLSFYAERRLNRAIDNAEIRDGMFIIDRRIPWARYINAGLYDKCYFIIMPSPTDGTWMARSIPKNSIYAEQEFLPRRWRGKPQMELRKISSTKDLISCNETGTLLVGHTKTSVVSAIDRAFKLKRKG